MTLLASAAGVACLWLGFELALIVEARVKFKAPSLTRAVGLDVGRHVFAAFGRIELLFLVALAILLTMFPPSTLGWVALGVITFVIVLQAGWLRPSLATRAAKLIQGESPEKSHVHVIYLSLELLKLGALLFLTFFTPAPEAQ